MQLLTGWMQNRGRGIANHIFYIFAKRGVAGIEGMKLTRKFESGVLQYFSRFEVHAFECPPRSWTIFRIYILFVSFLRMECDSLDGSKRRYSVLLSYTNHVRCMAGICGWKKDLSPTRMAPPLQTKKRATLCLQGGSFESCGGKDDDWFWRIGSYDGRVEKSGKSPSELPCVSSRQSFLFPICIFNNFVQFSLIVD